MDCVDYLKKIELSLEFRNTSDEREAFKSTETMEFIFGIGTSGITPFEKMLYSKSPGDEVVFQINKSKLSKTFEHINYPPLLTVEDDALVSLKATILNVSTPKDIEVVKAMAGGGHCGSSGCGCGCG